VALNWDELTFLKILDNGNTRTIVPQSWGTQAKVTWSQISPLDTSQLITQYYRQRHEEFMKGMGSSHQAKTISMLD
jgi:hypothetical protein